MRLGMIVRMDDSGLGNQTRNLAETLNPDKLLIIDSRPFNNRPQHPEWYAKWNHKIISHGFPTRADFSKFLFGIDALLTCEIPYGYHLFTMAKARGARTYLQYNYEFLDYLNQPNLPRPTALVAPSEWGVDDITERTGMLPTLIRPPLDAGDFDYARSHNTERTRRFLHVVGTAAIHDRNGTESVIRAAEHSNSSFQLVIKSQQPLELSSDDPRIVFDTSHHAQPADLYVGFDAMILPRRYGGLCLPMNEALMSGLPVIMTDISPNSDVLPSRWLASATPIDTFMTRTMVTVYDADVAELAYKIDWLCNLSDKDLTQEKLFALSLAVDEFGRDKIKERYQRLFERSA